MFIQNIENKSNKKGFNGGMVIFLINEGEYERVFQVRDNIDASIGTICKVYGYVE